eukprot:scaffold25534_cov54-Phaeocystis_antarctica.AAC.1
MPAAYTKGWRSHCLGASRSARQGLPFDRPITPVSVSVHASASRLEGRAARGGQLPRHAPPHRGVARGPRASAAPRRGRRRRVREEPLECVSHRSLRITPCSLIITPRCARNHFGATPRARAECGRLESWEDVAVLLSAVEEAHALLP